MVIYLYLVILIVICIITGIITTIVEHKRLIPKKKRSLIRVVEAPSIVYQSIDSHINQQAQIISIIDNSIKPSITEQKKNTTQVEVLNDDIEVLDAAPTSSARNLI